MKLIPLTQGKFAQVDDEDYDFLMQWKWSVNEYPKNKYRATRTIWIDKKVNMIYMHRIIMGTPENLQVDHIDHNGLNNQKYNLRNCTHAENHRNITPHGEIKYIGVSYSKNYYKNKMYKRIAAFIKVNQKSIFLGNFKTEEDAAKARDKASLKYFGEFANLNFK